MFNNIVIPYIVLLILTLATSTVLCLWRSDLFSFQATIPATLTYFGLFYLLFKLPSLRVVRKANLEKSQKTNHADSLSSEAPKLGWIGKSFLFGEIGLFLLLTIVSTAIGGVSGLVWWSAGGYQIRSIVEALRIGFILGAAVVILLFTGG